MYTKKILLILTIVGLYSCKTEQNSVEVFTTEAYELHKSKNQRALLVLFPGGGGNAEGVKQEFKIIDKATENGISVAIINFSHKLWIEDSDCKMLSDLLAGMIETHQLDTKNISIGGMSIGGNVTLSLTQYLLKNQFLDIKTAFVVDPPLDLYGLYKSSENDIKRTDFSEERLAEPKWIISYFEEQFGKNDLLENIEKVSPFTLATHHTDNISALKSIKLRFYIEPDAEWWMKERQTDFEFTNAYAIQKLNESLKVKGWKYTQLIETKNKGYRSNGERHPHSWSIVDVANIVEWILKY